MDCIFCKIASKQMKADVLFEDEQVMAFEDIHPQAPVHSLIVPKKHIATVNDLLDEDAALAGKLFLLARDLAKKKNIDRSGYRLITNCNAEGGQMVFHLHMHLLGGRPLGGKLVK